MTNFPTKFNAETDQLLVVWDPGDEVRQLVVVDGPRLDEFLEELICSPEHQQNPAVVNIVSWQ